MQLPAFGVPEIIVVRTFLRAIREGQQQG